MVDRLQLDETSALKQPSPGDLQEIFDAIDDRLAFWQVLYNDALPNQVGGLLLPLGQVDALAADLKMSSAPLYPSLAVDGLRGIAYRLLNLVIKIFGRPQIQFNRQQRDFLNQLQSALHAANDQMVAMGATIDENRDRLRALEGERSDQRQEIEALNAQILELHAIVHHSAIHVTDEKRN